MPRPTTKPAAVQPEGDAPAALFDDWFDPIEVALRDRVGPFPTVVSPAAISREAGWMR